MAFEFVCEVLIHFKLHLIVWDNQKHNVNEQVKSLLPPLTISLYDSVTSDNVAIVERIRVLLVLAHLWIKSNQIVRRKRS